MLDRKGAIPVGEDGTPSESGHPLEMPWILISNQIQQLNERFNDVNARIDDLNTNLSQRIDDLNTNLSKRIEDVNTHLSKRIDDLDTNLSRRIDGLDKRMEGVEARLANRFSAWTTLLTGIITALLGFILGRSRL